MTTPSSSETEVVLCEVSWTDSFSRVHDRGTWRSSLNVHVTSGGATVLGSSRWVLLFDVHSYVVNDDDTLTATSRART